MAIQKISGVTIDLTSQAAGDVAYYDSEVTSWVSLAKGEPGEVLTMNEEADAPRWGAAPPTWLPLGTLRGYSCGGNNGSWYTSTRYNNIDSYSFVSDGNATDWGDLIRDNYYMASTSSATHGYICGGEHNVGSWPNQSAVRDDHIQKFSMAANANATDVGDITVAHDHGTAHTDGTNGYHCYTIGWPNTSNIVDRFPFATDSDATDVGDVNVNTSPNGNISSVTHGYYTADPGVANGALAGNINQFSFASPATATDVGDMIVNPANGGGSQSETHGYISGGAGNSNQIQKFSFATLGNSTDVGDMLHGGNGPACASSTTHNYNAGGWQSEQNPTNQINKWTTANDNNATDVGDLWAPNYGNVGTQV